MKSPQTAYDLAAQVTQRAAIIAALGPERALGITGEDSAAEENLRWIRDALDALLRPMARVEYETQQHRPYPDSDDDGEDYYPALTPVVLTRYQVQAWAGRTLTADEVHRLHHLIPFSSIPDSIGTITETFTDQEG